MIDKISRVRRELAGALLWIALGLWVMYAGRDLGLGHVRDPGAGFMLFWVGVVIAALGVGLAVTAVRAEAADAPPLWPGRRWSKVVAVLVALVAYAYALEWLGFLVTTAIVLVFLFRAVEPQRWSIAVLGGVASTLAAWIVFRLWLGAQLPRGIVGIG